MTNLKKRERARTNASLISMVQRFSDITIMVGGLWAVCWVSGQSFLYMHLLMALIALVVFQMIGGMTDFYRSCDAPRDKCAHFREINGIAAAFQYLQKNYIPTALSFL